jgi:hypothetical protein
MDLIVSQGPRGLFLGRSDTRGFGSARGGNIVAISPRAGPHMDSILRGLARVDGWIVSPLSCVLAAAAHTIAREADAKAPCERSRSPPGGRRCCCCCGESEAETEDFETLCDGCLRGRELSPPPVREPDPSAPLLTEEALTQHTLAGVSPAKAGRQETLPALPGRSGCDWAEGRRPQGSSHTAHGLLRGGLLRELLRRTAGRLHRSVYSGAF